MTQYFEEAGAVGTLGSPGPRRHYVKPFVKNLDIVETEGGKQAYIIETYYAFSHGVS
jgi:hypothetical protein